VIRIIIMEKLRYPIRPGNVIGWLTTLSLCIAFGMLALGAVILFDLREDAWRQAEQASNNLVVALERDIARNIAVYDLSLHSAIDALARPDIDQISPETRHMTIFDGAASAEYLGSIVMLDANGTVVEDSTSLTPHTLNLSDRDYFRIHQNQSDAGLFVSRPFRSRLRNGDPSIAISRRVSGADGRFRGVVAGSMRLAYFQNLFDKLDLGHHGTLTLLRADGRVIMRSPLGEGDIDRDLGGDPAFRNYLAAPFGHWTGTSLFDGVERLFTFRQLDGLPLILTVAVSADDILAPWRRKALGIGLVLTMLCSASMTLCVMFRGELLRRMAAEKSLIEAGGRLLTLATTDALTGLTNRGAFEERLTREWRRAIRAETPIALLMLDADCFKLFNDNYGHGQGDQVLQGIASCIERNVRRPADTAARYGGEEFAALLPDTDFAGALDVAERIRAAVVGLGISHIGSPSKQVTVSIGVAVARPRHGELSGMLLKDADERLYDAKRGGRNRVSSADPPAMVWESTIPIEASPMN
jgi:diguanylate cyclase (GGDEF)-like protein